MYMCFYTICRDREGKLSAVGGLSGSLTLICSFTFMLGSEISLAVLGVSIGGANVSGELASWSMAAGGKDAIKLMMKDG